MEKQSGELGFVRDARPGAFSSRDSEHDVETPMERALVHWHSICLIDQTRAAAFLAFLITFDRSKYPTTYRDGIPKVHYQTLEHGVQDANYVY
jgi:hypothetical protein